LNISSYCLGGRQGHSFINSRLAFIAPRWFSPTFFLVCSSASSLCSGVFCQNSELSSATFSPLLSQPLLFSLTQTALNEVIKSRRILAKSIELKGCKFLGIRDTSSSRGVCSSMTLRIIECKFRFCQARVGGAISAWAGVLVLSTVVISCRDRNRAKSH
jgi:hypothetical protein